MVRRPAIYELKDEKDLWRAYWSLPAGFCRPPRSATSKSSEPLSHQKQTMLSLDIPASDDDSEATKKLDSFEIQDGDRIRVFPIAQGERRCGLSGGPCHPAGPIFVSRRHARDRFDFVLSRICCRNRLCNMPKSFASTRPISIRPWKVSILQDALANPSQAPVLHAMDTVRIFSRFDFENPPTVSVLGDVRAPGTYQTSGQIHLADAVHLAGGLAPDAQTDDAQVFRYMPDGKAKIFSVSLSQALAGDPDGKHPAGAARPIADSQEPECRATRGGVHRGRSRQAGPLSVDDEHDGRGFDSRWRRAQAQCRHAGRRT